MKCKYSLINYIENSINRGTTFHINRQATWGVEDHHRVWNDLGLICIWNCFSSLLHIDIPSFSHLSYTHSLYFYTHQLFKLVIGFPFFSIRHIPLSCFFSILTHATHLVPNLIQQELRRALMRSIPVYNQHAISRPV